MVEVMTDQQLQTILEMVDMILDGCNDLAEAKKKVRKLIKNQGGGKKRTWTEHKGWGETPAPHLFLAPACLSAHCRYTVGAARRPPQR